MNKLVAACTAILALIFTTPALAEPAGAQAPAEQRLGHISVIQLGTRGSPVILIPGLATPRAVWGGVAPDLARSHRVYLIQVNGFGGDVPDRNLEGQVLAGVVSDLHAVIRQHKLEGAAVVGHSLGGLVALMLGRDHPGDVGRLMIVDALPFFGVLATPPGAEASAAKVEPMARAMRDAVMAQFGKPADPAVTERQVAGMALSPEAATLLRGWAPRADARIVGAAMYEGMTTDLRPDLPRIAAPITLVYPWAPGRFTAEQTAAFYRKQYSGTPHIAFAEVSNAAHFVMLDQPAAFAAKLAVFLR